MESAKVNNPPLNAIAVEVVVLSSNFDKKKDPLMIKS